MPDKEEKEENVLFNKEEVVESNETENLKEEEEVESDTLKEDMYDRETVELILENMRKYIKDNGLYLCQTLTETKIEMFISKIY